MVKQQRDSGGSWSRTRRLSRADAVFLAFIVTARMLSVSDGQAVTTFVYSNMNMYDSSFADVSSLSLNDCRARCLASPQCGSFKWAARTCSLVSTLEPSFYAEANVWSGVKIGAGVATTPLSFAYADPSTTNQLLLKSSALYSMATLTLTYDAYQTGLGLLVSPVQILRDVNSRCQAASFSTSFSFMTHHYPTVFAADGFTFFMSAFEFPIESLGIVSDEVSNSRFQGFVSNADDQSRRAAAFAVEFDTFNDSVNADPDNTHVGLNFNFNPASVTRVSTLPARISLQDYRQKFAWIDYDALTSTLQMFLSYSAVKPSTPMFSHPLNLCTFLRPPAGSTWGTTTAVYMGFSGATQGDYGQSTHIFSWAFQSSWPANNTGTPPPGPCTIIPNCRISGYDIPGNGGLSSATPADCCGRCTRQPGCRAWTFRPKKKLCYLKYVGDSIIQDSSAAGFVCGERTRVIATTPLSVAFANFFNISRIMFVFGATILADSNIRLTYDQNQQGVALYQQPVQLLRDVNNTCEAASFNATFSFYTTSEDGYDYYSGYPWGEGFTFMVLASNILLGQIGTSIGQGANLGFTLETSGVLPGSLAVEFDSNPNTDLGLGPTELPGDHVGVNVRYSPSSLSAVLTNRTNISLTDSRVKTVWVDYDARARVLLVYLSYTSVKPTVPILSQAINLCQILRPADCLRSCSAVTTAYIGFSASTSSNVQYTEIQSFSFASFWPNGNIEPPPLSRRA